MGSPWHKGVSESERRSSTDELFKKISAYTAAAVRRLDDEPRKLNLALSVIDPDFTIGNQHFIANKDMGVNV